MNNELEYVEKYADWIWFKSISHLFNIKEIEILCDIKPWGLQGALARDTKRFRSAKKLSVLRKKLTEI